MCPQFLSFSIPQNQEDFELSLTIVTVIRLLQSEKIVKKFTLFKNLKEKANKFLSQFKDLKDFECTSLVNIMCYGSLINLIKDKDP